MVLKHHHGNRFARALRRAYRPPGRTNNLYRAARWGRSPGVNVRTTTTRSARGISVALAEDGGGSLCQSRARHRGDTGRQARGYRLRIFFTVKCDANDFRLSCARFTLSASIFIWPLLWACVRGTKIRTQIGGGLADFERVVAGVALRQKGFGLHRFGHSAGAGAFARENVAGHFLARGIQQAEDRSEIRGSGGGRFNLDCNVRRLIQMEAGTMRFAGLRQCAFSVPGILNTAGSAAAP